MEPKSAVSDEKLAGAVVPCVIDWLNSPDGTVPATGVYPLGTDLNPFPSMKSLQPSTTTPGWPQSGNLARSPWPTICGHHRIDHRLEPSAYGAPPGPLQLVAATATARDVLQSQVHQRKRAGTGKDREIASFREAARDMASVYDIKCLDMAVYVLAALVWMPTEAAFRSDCILAHDYCYKAVLELTA